MELKLIRHLWGVNLTWEQAFPRIKAEGFVGIESPLPQAGDLPRFQRLLAEHGFEYIAMAFTGGATVAEHVQSMRRQLTDARQAGATRVTCHSGADAFTREQADEFFREAVAIEADLGLTLAHETHRGRILFNPWITRDILEANERIKLCCDFSHWVCVAERLLGDCGPIMELAAERCVHLHARVGYEQGPQVPDPSAPEYRRHLEAHEAWWRMVWQSQRRRKQTSTVTPEFGPPGYMHTLPHTDQPVADLWNVCHWMAQRVRSQYALVR
jgi:hypothetical protein